MRGKERPRHIARDLVHVRRGREKRGEVPEDLARRDAAQSKGGSVEVQFLLDVEDENVIGTAGDREGIFGHGQRVDVDHIDAAVTHDRRCTHDISEVLCRGQGGRGRGGRQSVLHSLAQIPKNRAPRDDVVRLDTTCVS